MKKNDKKQLFAFSFASFFNDVGSDMIAPIWPIFVTSVLGANATVLGFLDGLGIALVSLSNMVSGYLSDKLGKRKPFIWIGYAFSGLSRVGYYLSSVWQQLIPFKIFDRVGKIRGAPRDALVSQLADKEERGRSFGLLRSMDGLGAVFGTLFSIILISLVPVRTILLIAAFPSIISTLLIFFYVKDKKMSKIFKGFKPLKMNSNLWIFFAINVIFSLTTFSYSFLLLFAKKIGFENTMLPILYLVFTLIYALFSYQFGKLSDRIKRKPVIIISYLFFAVMCLMIIFTQNLLFSILIFVLYGLFNASMNPVQRTFVSDLSYPESRGTVLGMFQMFNGLAAVPAGLITGFLWQVNYILPFILGLVSSLFCAFLMIFVKE